MKVMTRPKPVEIVTCAEAIRAEMAKGDEHYRVVGQLFAEQKALLGHGQWLPWLEAEGFNERQARRYMAYAKSDPTVRYADWRDAQEEKARVIEDVDHAERVKEVKAANAAGDAEVEAEEQPEELDEELVIEEQPLARKLVDVGFKRLAAELHPDKGSTSEAMIRLVNVRAKLTVLIEGGWA